MVFSRIPWFVLFIFSKTALFRAPMGDHELFTAAQCLCRPGSAFHFSVQRGELHSGTVKLTEVDRIVAGKSRDVGTFGISRKIASGND